MYQPSIETFSLAYTLTWNFPFWLKVFLCLIILQFEQISMDDFVLGPGERQLSSIQVESAEVAEWSQEHELLQAGEENQMEEQMQVVESEAEANQVKTSPSFPCKIVEMMKIRVDFSIRLD